MTYIIFFNNVIYFFIENFIYILAQMRVEWFSLCVLFHEERGSAFLV